MTTLGFGDMHANPTSEWGYTVLSAQVIMGYVMLGALVTRLGILFTGSGPMAEVKGRHGKVATRITTVALAPCNSLDTFKPGIYAR